MTDKLAKKVQENREIAEQNIGTQLSQANTASKQQLASMMLGAVAAVGHISRTLSAQTIRGLQRIREEKLFESFGYTRFDDFLDDYQYSPMTYRQFNDREKLLETEGDDVFDVMNSLKLSHRQRKMLGAGHVQIDGETVIVVTLTPEGDEKVEEIELADRTRLLQTLSALADQNANLNSKSNRQQEKIEKGEKEIEKLQKKLDSGQFTGTESNAHFSVYLTASQSIDQMANTVKKLSEEEAAAHGELYFSSLNVAMGRLQDAYKKAGLNVVFTNESSAPRSKSLGDMDENEIENYVAKKMKGGMGDVEEENEFEAITSGLNDDELAEMMD